jgi:hypothetical protein
MELYSNQNDTSDTKRVKKIVIALICLIFIVIIAIYLSNTNRIKKNITEPDITDHVITNCYFDGLDDFLKDYPNSRVKSKEVAKFMLIFTKPLPYLEDIKEIVIKGPQNYKKYIDIKTEYTRENLNGYLYLPYTLIFQYYDVDSFLKNGKYSITIVYKSGKSYSVSKDITYNSALVNNYKAMKLKFSPNGNLLYSNYKNKIKFKWSKIFYYEYFYCFRLAEYKNPMSWLSGENVVYFDNIFAKADDIYGLNKKEILVNIDYKKNVKYTWFVEITDSNILSKVNMVIYKPFQYFTLK